jgi:hypothetical protein
MEINSNQFGNSYSEYSSDQEAGSLRAQLSFYMLCFYLLSQAFMIPIKAVGPSWALWPRLADIAFAGMILSYLMGSRDRDTCSAGQLSIFKSLVLIFLGCIVSYILNIGLLGQQVGILDGAYDLARLLQFFLIYWVTIHIPFSDKRIKTIRFLLDLTFLFVCAGIILTYFSVIPLGSLTAHLPQDPNVAGSWSDYVRLDRFDDVHKGLGTISYTHAYGAVQVLMLLCLRLQLTKNPGSILCVAYMVLGLVVIVFTESRAGLAAALLFAGANALKNPKVIVLGIPLLGVLLISFNMEAIDSTIRHQKAIVSVTEGDSLSGRPLIWKRHLDSLKANPLHLLIGAGFGSARVAGKGSNGHMLYLHIVAETGFIGLLVFSALIFIILKTLYRYEAGSLVLFWGTIALLLSGLTQETFYPVPSMAHFIGLYLVALAVALRKHHIGDTRWN